MSNSDLAHFRALVRARSGIIIEPEKDYLIQSRLAPIAGTLGYASVETFLAALRQVADARTVDAALDAMTTNETYFFRDQTPFDHLRRLLVDWGRKGRSRVRIWSAACSTGQEPYSIAMLWLELAHLLPSMQLDIVATDLSDACLTRAKAGVYSAFEAQRGLPVQKLIRHFEQDGPNWRAKAELRNRIEWRRQNLLESHALGRFDIVFCRNVLIYFEPDVRSAVLGRIADSLVNDGRLILGASETVLGVSKRFAAAAEAPGLYALAAEAALAR